jgi:hypothetical protein
MAQRLLVRCAQTKGVREMDFYCTRHTFITEMVAKDVSLKKIADYFGTSVAMIEQHYCAKAELDPDNMENGCEARQVFAKSSANTANTMASPTGFEPVLSA